MNGPIQTPDRLRWLVITTAVLLLLFSVPLYQWARFALGSELYSHLVLIPLISAYLVWRQRKNLPPPSPSARSWAAALFGAGAAMLAIYLVLLFSGTVFAPEDALALTMLSLVLLFWGVCSHFLGRAVIRALAFPLAFLVFMAPFPHFLRTWTETILQHGSADAAHAFFATAGTPVLRHDMAFQLPGFSLEVAPECSGIHSTLALFITSLVAAYVFLRRPWTRAMLAFAVIPLAFLRNGFRVFTIGELCVHVGPQMIDSPIHRHGGPLFFALSLIPFFLLLLWLARLDRRIRAVAPSGKR
jgi:exosortase C (VPDSG-CTERM-specific)